MVATARAKQRIRGWLKQEEQNRSISVGRELLAKDLRKVKLSLEKVMKEGGLQKIADDLLQRDVNTLFAQIAYGKITTSQIVSRLLPGESDIEARLAAEHTTIQKLFQSAAKNSRERAGVRVSGLEDVVFRFAQCCEPLPGDQLVGYITRGRGVAIHAVGCPETLSFDPQRIIPVSWEENVKTQRRVTLQVLALDKIGMLAALTQAISSSGANIVSAQVSTSQDRKAVNYFEVNVESSAQLEAVRRSLEKIVGVLRVERTKKRGEKGEG
jgi:GTP pyrophosphokinase